MEADLPMTGTLLRVGSLLAAVAILLAGHGLQLTLLPIRAEVLGWSTQAIGITGSAYFIGFVAGCLTIPSLVARVAHIRTFMVMGAVATLALLGAGLADWFPAWLVLRFATGFAMSGLYMVIESWLSDAAPEQQRGGVLAVYSMICLVAMVVGQAFLGYAPPDGLELVAIGAGLLCLAIVPVGVTRMAPPHPLPRTRFSPGVLLRASRVAVACAFFGGLVTGAFWAMGPVVGRSFGLDSGDVGRMMGAAILGGALVQLPVGRLSDRMDRRLVIAGMLTTGTAVALTGWLLAGTNLVVLYVAMFFIGAASMPLYALCIATASDRMQVPLIQIASGILVMNSLGSIIGPLVVAPMVGWIGGPGFFLYVTVCFGVGALWTLHRIVRVERPAAPETPFVSLPKTTPVVAELSSEEAPPAPAAAEPAHAGAALAGDDLVPATPGAEDGAERSRADG
jgi:MFS family permease